MEPQIRQLKLAHEIDSLEETKNKLIKCYHRLEQCNRLHKQYVDLKRQWKARDVRYQSLKKEKEELVRINRRLEREKHQLEARLHTGIAKLSSTAGRLGSLEKRYMLLKTACKRYVSSEDLPPSPRPPSSPIVVRSRRQTPRRLTLKDSKRL